MEDGCMKSEYPFSPFSADEKKDELAPSRFIDEQISDENSVEAKADSIHKPAGLNNPFWN
jgi:hypothetical protein